MKHFFFILLLLCYSVNLFGATQLSDKNQKTIDSLNAVINNSYSHDTTIIMSYLELANYYYLNNPDEAFRNCKKAEKLSENIHFLKGEMDSYGWLGYLYEKKGNTPLALEYNHKSLDLTIKIKDKKSEATILNNIGLIYQNKQDYDLAMEYFFKSLDIRKEIDDKGGIALAYINIGHYYKNHDDINIGLEYFSKALKSYTELGDERGKSYAYNNIGIIYEKKNEFKTALEYYNKSLTIGEETQDINGIIYSLIQISSINIIQGDLITAEQNSLRSLQLAKEIGYVKEIKISAIKLLTIYEKMGKGMQALEMHKLYITMRDSLNNQATQKALAQQQAKYEYENQKAIDDLQYEKQIALEKEAKSRQKVITYFIASGLALVVVFLVFVFNRLRITKQQKKTIENQKQIVEHQKAEVEEAHQEIQDSIAYAKRIQSAILPPIKLVKEYLKESFILYKPKDVVAGDFYWLEHKDNKVLFAAADCTGHGVPGAMVSVVCNNALNRSVREHGLIEPGEILTKTREIVIQEFEKSEEDVKDGMDIALCSLEGKKLKYAGAHNPLWIIRNGEIIETKANKQPIGQFDNPEPYTTYSFDLEQGDSIYIFSDGYVDQFGGEKGKKFKPRAFRELLLSIQSKPMDEQKTIIDEAFETWRDDLEQVDDVCVIGVRV